MQQIIVLLSPREAKGYSFELVGLSVRHAFFNRLQRRLLSGAFFNHVLLNNFDSNVARVLILAANRRAGVLFT